MFYGRIHFLRYQLFYLLVTTDSAGETGGDTHDH